MLVHPCVCRLAQGKLLVVYFKILVCDKMMLQKKITKIVLPDKIKSNIEHIKQNVFFYFCKKLRIVVYFFYLPKTFLWIFYALKLFLCPNAMCLLTMHKSGNFRFCVKTAKKMPCQPQKICLVWKRCSRFPALQITLS